MADEAMNIQIDDEPITSAPADAPPAETPAADPPADDAPSGKASDDNDEGDDDEQSPPVKFDDDQQAKFNKEVGKKVAKQREAERRADEAERKLAEKEAADAQQSMPPRPEIPPVPDPFDDKYEELLAARDESIKEAAAYDAVTAEREKQEQEAVRGRMDEAVEKQMKVVGDYTERAETLGIASEDLTRAGNEVAKVGMDGDLVAYLLEDDQGPNVTMYLADNLTEVEKINQMSVTKAAVYIENTVKPLAMKRKGAKQPPAPTSTPRGSGMPEGKRGPKGATYE